MKIKVTKAELLAIVSKTLGFEVTEVVIAKPANTVWTDFLTKLAKEMCLGYADAETIKPEHKIPAIKALRTLTGYGLAEAKWAVENWSAYSKAFIKYGRPPIIEGPCFSDNGPKLR